MNLGIDGIIKLIGACTEHGITSFKGLGVEFSLENHPRPVLLSEEDRKRAERQALEANEIAVTEDKLDILRLEDPLKYEELVAQGEI